MTRWHPSLDLTRLLEAMSEEILAATDEEVRQASALHGGKIANSATEIRELVRVARGDANGHFGQNFGPNEALSGPGARLLPTCGGRGWLPYQRH